ELSHLADCQAKGVVGSNNCSREERFQKRPGMASAVVPAQDAYLGRLLVFPLSHHCAEVILAMKNVLACALGIVALAVWAMPCRADGCCGSGCAPACGCKSVSAASCCDDCCKPSLRDRLKACFHKKDDCCCEAPKCCEKPKCCDDCCKPSLR